MPSVQSLSVALLIGVSALATPILGGPSTVSSLIGGKPISDILRNNHGQSNDWKKHPTFPSVCSTLENPRVLLDNVRRGDWSSCTDQSLREDWKQLLESCCESREHDGEWNGKNGDHDNKPWDDGKKHECKSVEESRRLLEQIKKNNYSECPKELKHDEWKKHVEACCEEEKEWKGEDDEWKGENGDDDDDDDEWKGEDKEWDGEDKEWDGEDKEWDGKGDGKDGEWKGGKDGEHHGKKCTAIEESQRLRELIRKEDYSECPQEFKHEEWKKFIEECCEQEGRIPGKHPLPRVPEHTCIPSKHLPTDYAGTTVESWLSTLDYERDIIHERSQFDSVMLD